MKRGAFARTWQPLAPLKELLARWSLIFVGVFGVAICPAQSTDSAFVASFFAESQEKAPKLKEKVKHTGSLVYRFIKNFDAYDSTYIEPNHYNFTFMAQSTSFFQPVRFFTTTDEGIRQSLKFSPQASVRLGPYFGWRWIFLGYTWRVSPLKKAKNSTELSLSLYSSMLGGDIMRIRNKGDFKIREATGFGDAPGSNVCGQTFTGLNAYTDALNAYYVFNYKHFSYPAAFNQSTVQRKSCGSWMLGFRYNHQKIEFDHTRLPDILQPWIADEMKFTKINYTSVAVSGGYSYNWVFARNCLFGISLMPSIGFKKAKGQQLDGRQIWFGIKNLNFDAVSRIGVVWNNTRHFAGVSFISYLYDYTQDKVSLMNSMNYLNLYAGFYFHRRK